MDNQNYAKWIPEAGGYVYNGNIVSTNPIYDNTGRQEVDVDISRLTPQSSTTDVTKQQPASAVDTSIGTQLNQAGSNEDVNSTATKAGAMASLNLNKENSNYGVLNTPATSSVVAGEIKPVSPLEQAQKDYQYMVATNNLKGQIDALTTMGQLDGVDYSQQITDLTKQRNQKIMNQDNAYSQQISDAYASGDYQTAATLRAEQQAYRDKVGYQNALQSDYEMKQAEVELDYQETYMQGVNDITNAILQQVSNLINFQYNPNNDMALQVAQGYAVGAVKEQMNHTGMYYSTMTQSAIARAVAELVPVYEKMAKEEIQQNIQLLQNTANFLLNLEETQFNLWKGQIEMKWEANAEKRKEYQAALDRANAWGYVSNEDAAILNVSPGTLSPEAIKEARALQQQIDKENRALQQDKELARYKADLELEYAQKSAMIKAAYATSSSSGSRNSGGSAGGSLSMTELTKTLVPYIKAGMSDEDLISLAYNLGKNDSVVFGAISAAKQQATDETSKAYTEELDKLDKVSNDVKENVSSLDLLKKYNTYLSGSQSTTDTKEFISKLNGLDDSDRLPILDSLYTEKVANEIDKQAAKFSNDSGPTSEAIDKSIKKIEDYASLQNDVDANYYAEKGYKRLIDKINDAEAVDTSWWDWFGSTENDKKDAKQRVIDSIEKTGNTELLTAIKAYAK